MKIESILMRLGFSENEVRVYLAALELGISSGQTIAKKAAIKRTTAYSVLDYLVGRGVVGKTAVRGKARFVAEPPEKLLTTINDLRVSLEKAMPELDALYNKNEIKPKITFYEGEHAIHNVYEDTLKEKPKEILEWNTNAFFHRFPTDYNYIEKRTKSGIKARRIAGKGSLWDTWHKSLDDAELAETIIVPKELFDPLIEVNIYNNKIAFMNYAENMSVIIESKAIADAMRQVYELSWQGASMSKTNQ
ncbi:MAG: helix-turn-helix domain-containing protein [Candidatus Uhrbacteria bacterium]|nr:helix-turn-helix domain-containing protein [Candidatus Uhrbacteria bacterium]